MSAYAAGAGRGFSLSTYFFTGFGIFIVFCMLGAMVGGMLGLVWGFFRGYSLSGAAPSLAAYAKASAGGFARRALPRVARLWPWALGAMMLVVGATAFVLGRDMGKHVDRQLAEAIAAADRDDAHWRLDDLLAHREVVPDPENSALVMKEVHEVLPEKWPERDRSNAGGGASA